MSKRNFHCKPCNQDFHLEHDFQTHCQGKKHIACAKIAEEKDASRRSVFVRGFQKYPGINKCPKFLESYFSHFGKVKKVKLRGKVSSQFAIVEFEEFSSVTKCLNVKQHSSDSTTLMVRKSVYHPPRSEQMRLIHRQNEEEEKEKTEQSFLQIKSLLSSFDNLLDQMIGLSKKLKLPPEDENSRYKICQDLTKLCAPYFENSSVHQFGSSINSFGVAGCDLDLYLNLHNQNPPSNPSIKKFPLPFHKDLKSITVDSAPLTHAQLGDIDINDLIKLVMRILTTRSDIYSKAIIIPSHRCPIIKFLHRPTGIKCDLSLNNRKALYNSLLLRLYGSEPRVHALVSTVRLWAKCHGLAGGVGKGHVLTSYALTLLVLFFVMTRQPQILPKVCNVEKCISGAYKEQVDEWECISLPPDAVLPKSDNTENVVDLLKGFFNFYANDIDWDRDALMMWDNSVISRASISLDPFYTSCRIGCMTLLDPFVLTHNVLGNINEKVKAVFMKEVKRATELTSLWSDCAPVPKSEPWGIAELLLPSQDPQPKELVKSLAGTSTKGQPAAMQREHITKMDGEQDNGDFIIALQSHSSVGNLRLQEESELHRQIPSKQWCHLAHALVLDVLKKVFMADVAALAASCRISTAVVPECSGIQSSVKSVSGTKIDSQEEILDASGAKRSNDVALIDKENDNEQEEMMELSGGKRSSDVALLDCENNEVPLPVRNCNEVTENNQKRSSDRVSSLTTDKSERKVTENPEKRFCDGLSSLETKLDNHTSSIRYKDVISPIIVAYSENNARLRSDSPEVFSYTCKCKHWLWVGRNKIRKSVSNTSKLSGLDLEVEISKLLLKEKEKLTMKAQLAKQGGSDDQPSSVDSQTAVDSSKPLEPVVDYQCDIHYMNTETLQPHILIKLRPVPDCANQFKNFYCPFRAMISRLIGSNLFDS